MKKIIFLFGLFILSACTKNFEDINTNPNAPETVNPQFLLASVIYNAANNNAVDAWNAGNFLAQLTARFDFNEIDRYDLRANQELWEATYLLMRDVQTIINLSENGGNETYKGVALVMRAFLAATLTDLWRDVPYTEALRGESDGNFTPVYDSQANIYVGANGILQTLRQAVEILEANANNVPIEGDIMFNGNVQKWIQFANSLRVRYLMRISKRIDVSTELQEIVTEGNLMISNSDNGLVPYLATAPNQWFVYNIREGDYANVRMSETIDDVLKNLNDPRIEVLFKPTVSGTPLYGGIPNGLGPDSRNNYDLTKASNIGAIFRDVPDGADAVFMLYSEVQFALAEAAHKGLISGDKKAYYENGIQATFDYYNVEMPVDYLTRPEVELLNDGQDLEKIMTQKWLASFLVGYEGWFNFRRTGFPAFSPALDNLNNDIIPSRYLYPTTEQALNKANYDDAVQAMGGDTYNIKAWWE